MMFSIFKKAGVIAVTALGLLLAAIIGNGGDVSGWVLWYLGALAFVSMCGMFAAVFEEKSYE